ncbi:sirohydrochlorin cobaltochelatase [Mycoplasma sp. P36-A1]|uniref:sirohydrochlorin cobaltochelatase n=1 Tax=Mycoplasma sp. P36-A1 TaxID=3252900 RepID=UPI003C2DB0A4
MHKVIVLVHHGTSNEKINEKTYTKLKSEVEILHPHAKVYEVFTSRIVNNRIIKKRETFDNILDMLKKDNIKEIEILHTNLSNGDIYKGIISKLDNSKIDYKINKPLLDSLDLSKLVSILPYDKNKNIIFIGHGNSTSNKDYENLQNEFYKQTKNNVRVCVLSQLRTNDISFLNLDKEKDIEIYPLMFVEGFHAQKDVKSTIKIFDDYKCNYNSYSLGECKEIRNLFCEMISKTK